jgi:hypothetical protein
MLAEVLVIAVASSAALSSRSPLELDFTALSMVSIND